MTARRYKAVRPDLTDFHTGTVRYEVGTTVTHPAPERLRNDPSTYLSVATVPTDCTGMSWPCRLLAVEGVGRPMRSDDLPNKRCFSAVRVVEELPAHEVFGPQGAEVVALLDRASRSTADEAKRLVAARDAARDAAWFAARFAARYAARYAARDAAWYAAAWNAVWDAARAAAWDAALALVTRDLITPEQFDVLYGPWASVIGEEPVSEPTTGAEECPECEGSGVDFVMFDTETNIATSFPCEECDGTGEAS